MSSLVRVRTAIFTPCCCKHDLFEGNRWRHYLPLSTAFQMSTDCSDRAVCEHISAHPKRNMLLRSGGLFLVTLAKWKKGGGGRGVPSGQKTGFEEAASMMAAAAHNACPATFACTEGVDESYCTENHGDGGGIPYGLDLSGLFHLFNGVAS